MRCLAIDQKIPHARLLLAVVAATAAAACEPRLTDPEITSEAQPERDVATTDCEALEREWSGTGWGVRVTNPEAPEPWEYSERAMYSAVPEPTPGYLVRPADLGIPDPDANAMNHRVDVVNDLHFPLYRFIGFGIAIGYSPECGRGGYLLASPERIEELIAQSFWIPNGVNFPYRDEPDGLQGFGVSALKFVNSDRTTQCSVLAAYINDAGSVAIRNVLFPSIQCHISFAPDYAIGVVIPARLHNHLGEILMRIERDALQLVEAELQ